MGWFKMGWYHWVMIILLAFIIYQYLQPDNSSKLIDEGMTKVKSFIPIGSTIDCPTVTDLVCGTDKLTYQNACFANKAKVNFTLGACQIQ